MRIKQAFIASFAKRNMGSKDDYIIPAVSISEAMGIANAYLAGEGKPDYYRIDKIERMPCGTIINEQ